MVQGVKDAIWGTAGRWFPDRQIYHRSEGEVRYFEITTGMQIGALLGAAAMATWLCFTSVSVAFHGMAISQKNAEIEQIRIETEALINEALATEAAQLAQSESQREEFLDTVNDFEARHRMLTRLIDFAEGLHGVRAGDSPTAEDGRVMMAAAVEDPTPRVARDPLFIPASATANLATPEGRVEAMIAEQDAALVEAENAAEARLENLRAVLRLTGLSADDLIEDDDMEEQGGPLIAIAPTLVDAESGRAPDPYTARVARIASRLYEAGRLERLLTALPTSEPISVPHRRTSPYGDRIDPFTRRWAVHSGMDFGAYRRAPIVAAGPGRIVYAGWRSGYGRCVEIDHGYGFVTRYGHLHEIAVRRGDTVERGQLIGGMGSTGRSTATHLHYELWYDGSHIDPDRFLRAGQYVQQG